jgi:small-conductance mechanosensitive channel
MEYIIMSFRIYTLFTIATSTPINTATSTVTVTPTSTATPVGTITPTSTAQYVGILPSPEKIMSPTTLDLSAKIVISVLIMLVALGIGLYLRSRLVRSLKKGVLDRWIVETLGLLIILVPLIIGGIAALSVWRDLGSFFNELNTQHGINVYVIGEQFLETILLLAFGVGVARTVQNLTLRGLNEKRIDINLRTFISRMFYIVALIIIGFWILSIWQIPLGIPATAVSVISVVVAFAVQDILKDLVAGFYILVERPFFIGDQISVTIAPTVIYVGKVQDVKLRATKVRLVAGEEITIPNSILFGGAVINNTYYSERRAAITVTLPGADFSSEETVARIQKALAEIPTIIPKPEPVVIFSKYVEGKVILLVRFWMASGQIIDVTEAMNALHKLMPTAELAVVEPIGAA